MGKRSKGRGGRLAGSGPGRGQTGFRSLADGAPLRSGKPRSRGGALPPSETQDEGSLPEALRTRPLFLISSVVHEMNGPQTFNS